MKESKFKEDLTLLLSEAFNVEPEDVQGDRTTDFIVRIGKDESDWLYFELKSTDKSGRDNQGVYFGATSLSQLVEAEKHPNHYFFILASHDNGKTTYGIATPEELKSYLTGFYMRADFNIPNSKMDETCAENETFIKRCRMLQNGELPRTLSQKTNPNTDLIKKVNEIVNSSK